MHSIYLTTGSLGTKVTSLRYQQVRHLSILSIPALYHRRQYATQRLFELLLVDISTFCPLFSLEHI